MRTAYFLDIDNLTGSGQASQEEVRAVLHAFERECRPGVQDQVYCAATALAAYHVGYLRPGYRVVIGRGKDGADLRLLELADPEHLARRFQRVVVGSGDGIFTALVCNLRARGVKVGVLKGRGRIATHLYKSVGPVGHHMPNPVVSLPLNHPTLGAA